MAYNEGDFVLIEEAQYIAKKFIGEIQSNLKNNSYRLYVYIFPEDTIEGRQPYMSSQEVFFTPSQMVYNLSGNKKVEQKVEVLTLEEYVDKKYINAEKLECPLYFFRQTYLIERNRFEPENLPSICYCQEIFNPDIPFKKCLCGTYFHPDCLLQINTSKCWADNCDFDCNLLLSEEERFQKKRIISGEIKEGNINFAELEKDYKDYNDEKERLQRIQEGNLINIHNRIRDSDSDSDNDNDYDSDSDSDNDNDNDYNSDSDSDSYRKKKYNNKRNKNKNNKMDIDNEERKEQLDKDDEIDIIENEERNELLKELEKDCIMRENGRILILDIFKRCLVMIKNDLSLLEDYKNCEKKDIYREIKNRNFTKVKKHLNKLTLNVESILYDLYKKTGDYSIYFNFIKKNKDINLNNIDFLIKLILDIITPEEIIKGDLPSKKEDKEEVEKEISKEINDTKSKFSNLKIQFKSNVINHLIANQELDGAWEANEDNMKFMKCINIEYTNINDFKNNNKKALDELFGEEIDDDILMTIIFICILENYQDKEKIEYNLEKAYEIVKLHIKTFNKEFVAKFIDKILMNKIDNN